MIKNVAFVARAEIRYLILDVIKDFKEKTSCKIIFYCHSEEQLKFYERYDLIDELHLCKSLYPDDPLQSVPVDSAYERARAWEDKLGITLNSLIVPDRHYGRGYMLGGFHHPRSQFSQKSNYEQVLHAFCETLDFWQAEITERAIDLIVNGPRESAVVCAYLKVPYRVLVGSRTENLHFWAHNHFYEHPELDNLTFDQSLGLKPNSKDSDEVSSLPYFSHSESRKRHMEMFKFPSLVKNISSTLIHYFYWKLRGYAKARGYLIKDRIKYHWRKWYQYKVIQSIAQVKLDDLNNIDFVFFPLAIEPEMGLHGLSPEFFYQQSAIAAISRDLPAGVFLAVKETFGAVGRRPDNFYQQIAELKNVVMIDLWEPGIEVASKAKAAVTISGTTGFEAILKGVPVVTFGQHNHYNVVPGVKIVDKESRLKGHLRDAIYMSEVEKSELAAGARVLLSKIKEISFDLGEYNYIDLKSYNDDTAVLASNALIESV